MNISNKKILILSAHTDDADLAMGGTITKLVRNGNEIHHYAISSCHVPKIVDEFKKCQENYFGNHIVNVDSNDYWFGFEITETSPVRMFTYNRQQILDKLIYLRDFIQPDIVFCPSSNDCHQDHRVVYEECVRAFKNATILGYYLPWNNVSGYSPNCYIMIDDVELSNKLLSIGCYESQKNRPYSNPSFIRSLALVNGVSSGKNDSDRQYSEPFEVIRLFL